MFQVFYFRIDLENRTQGFVPADALTQMFASIQSIHQFHNDFLLKELEDRMENWSVELSFFVVGGGHITVVVVVGVIQMAVLLRLWFLLLLLVIKIISANRLYFKWMPFTCWKTCLH